MPTLQQTHIEAVSAFIDTARDIVPNRDLQGERRLTPQPDGSATFQFNLTSEVSPATWDRLVKTAENQGMIVEAQNARTQNFSATIK